MNTFKISNTIAKINAACSKDVFKERFSYIQFKKDEAGTLEFCGTDAHVLIYGNFAGFIGEEAAAILPSEFYIHMDQFKKLTAKKLEYIKIDNEAARIYCLDKALNEFDAVPWLAASEYVGKVGGFPNWKPIIPDADKVGALDKIYFGSSVLSRAIEAMTVNGIPSIIRYEFTGVTRACRISHQHTVLDFIKGIVMPIYKDGW